jgi:hypothetical protein
MKIYLASYFQPQYHGTGRRIGITPDLPPSLEKEVDYDCKKCYPAISPDKSAMIAYYQDRNAIKEAAGGGWDFNDEQKEAYKLAGERFSSAYREKLEAFVTELKKQAEETKQSVFELSGLNDNDTLLSLEKKGNKSFREITAEYLRRLGFDVVEN